MTTILAASWRLTTPYTALGASHKMRQYLDVVASADPTGYDVVDRLGAGGIGVSTAIEAMMTLYAPLFKAGQASFGTTDLEQRSGLSWNPIASFATTATPTGVPSTAAGTQVTLSMRDTAFHKVRQIFLDGNVGGPQKFTSVSGGPASINAWADGFSQVQIAASANPWLWVRGRSDLYVGSFVSVVIADNDRTRRQHDLM